MLRPGHWYLLIFQDFPNIHSGLRTMALKWTWLSSWNPFLTIYSVYTPIFPLLCYAVEIHLSFPDLQLVIKVFWKVISGDASRRVRNVWQKMWDSQRRVIHWITAWVAAGFMLLGTKGAGTLYIHLENEGTGVFIYHFLKSLFPKFLSCSVQEESS